MQDLRRLEGRVIRRSAERWRRGENTEESGGKVRRILKGMNQGARTGKSRRAESVGIGKAGDELRRGGITAETGRGGGSKRRYGRTAGEIRWMRRQAAGINESREQFIQFSCCDRSDFPLRDSGDLPD